MTENNFNKMTLQILTQNSCQHVEQNLQNPQHFLPEKSKQSHLIESNVQQKYQDQASPKQNNANSFLVPSVVVGLTTFPQTESLDLRLV